MNFYLCPRKKAASVKTMIYVGLFFPRQKHKECLIYNSSVFVILHVAEKVFYWLEDVIFQETAKTNKNKNRRLLQDWTTSC
jgi:hypothetical protein